MKAEVTSDVPKKRGCSPLAAVLLGCGTIILFGLIAAIGLGIWGYRWGMQQVDQFAAEYEAQGYERVTGQMIEVTSPVDKPQVYTAQLVTIRTDVNADLALMCQVVEIHGTVTGNIDFYGQVLTVKPNAAVHGNINVKAAQVIDVQGTLDGEVTGSYQVLNWPNRPTVPPSDDAPDTRGEATSSDAAMEPSGEHATPVGAEPTAVAEPAAGLPK
jgi:hypothetical protein